MVADQVTAMAITVFDQHLETVSVHGQTCEAFQLDGQVGSPLEQVFAPAVWRQLRRACQKALKGSFSQIEVRFQQQIYQIGVWPLSLPETTLGIVILLNVTHFCRAEEAWRLSESRYRALVDTQTELITAAKPDTSLTFINSGFSRLLGQSSYTLMGQSWLELIYPEDRAETRENLVSLSPETPLVKRESRLQDAHGHIRWIAWIDRGIFDEQGHLVEIQSVGHDITERRQAEQLLKTSLREKDVLLREVHHRVKNNLQIISSLLRLQANAYSDENNQVSAAFADFQNRILSIALVHERLYGTAQLEDIRLADYIKELTFNLVSSLSPDPTRLDLKVEVAEVCLDLDEAISCGLILNELITNALKYAFPRRQNKKRTPRRWYLGIYGQVEKDQLVLRIEDNGVGLPPNFSIEQAESLGLQLVWDLVEKLEGTLQVASTETGTAFTIRFSPSSLSRTA